MCSMDSHSKSSSKAAAVAAIAPPTVAVLYSMTTAASTSADTGMGPATYLFSVTLNSLVTKVQQQQYLPVLLIIRKYYPYYFGLKYYIHRSKFQHYLRSSITASYLHE